MKSVLGSAVFLASLFLLQRILVETGLFTLSLSLGFLACLVAIPLGGILFLEGAIDASTRDLRREIEALRAELDAMRGRADPPEG